MISKRPASCSSCSTLSPRLSALPPPQRASWCPYATPSLAEPQPSFSQNYPQRPKTFSRWPLHYVLHRFCRQPWCSWARESCERSPWPARVLLWAHPQTPASSETASCPGRESRLHPALPAPSPLWSNPRQQQRQPSSPASPSASAEHTRGSDMVT